MEDFVHLHVHTYYSILDGQASISKLVDKAVGNGMRGMAITDHGNMMGIKEFFNYCKGVNGKRKDAGQEPFKPIFGCEMYVVRNGRRLTDKEKAQGDSGGNHLVVLAKNEKGYHNLIKLVSKAWTDGFYTRPRTDHVELEKYHEGLIVCSACIAGEVPAKILKGDIAGAEESVLWFKRVFGDDYYLELQRHEVKDPSIRANRETFPLQQQANKVIIELARKHDVKLVCTNDSHFVDEENAEAHDRLLCLSTGKDLDDPTRMLYSKQEWFKTREEMNDVFCDIPEALANTCEILDKVETYSIDHDPIMPFFPIPAEFGSEEEYRKRITEQELYDEFTSDENGENQLSPEEGAKKIKKLGGYDRLYRIKFEADYLSKLAYDGARRLYGDPLTDEVRERVNFELHIMKTMGFPGYFLIVQDFINSAREELGVMVGPGRGSAAGSVVAYCLGITKIDPIKYDLLFERFLNPDRISLPDIDTDFDDDGRGRVLEWVEDKYGHDKVAHIITYGTMASKLAIKDVARVEQLPLSESDRLTKLIPKRMPEIDGKAVDPSLANCYAYVPQFKAELNSPNPLVAETLRFAQELEGTVRNTGVHACGVIICRDDITDWVPVSTAVDKSSDSKEKTIVTQYEGRVIEETGLIKMDFLGLKTLSIIKEALANIKRTTGKEIDIEAIDIDDRKTYDLYCQGNTIGTFQFESTGMQKYLRELQPSTFEDLIAMNALYRPGPMDYIPDFIARKHGREPIVYDIPEMEKYLKDTYGVTVYQEQVMLLSRLLAGFTRGQSDTLRKAMGKKLIDKMNELEKLFMEGGQANGHKPETLQKIWNDWKKFASYAFNKSHATCYSWVAYQTAYLKAHYPAEYMAGVLSRNLNAADKLTKIMDETRRMGIVVKGPDINESGHKFSVTKNGEIRFGLSGIKSVGDSAVNAIVSERRKNGPFKDLYDFVERVNLSACNRGAIESLALAGAFDSFGVAREMIVAPILDTSWADILVKYGQRIQTTDNSNNLFGDMMAEIQTDKPPYPEYEPWNRLKLLEAEKNLVTMYLSAHPLDPYYMELTFACNTTCDNFENAQEDGAVLTMGGLVTSVDQRTSKTGRPWLQVGIEDFNGTAHIRLFGKAYEANKNKFTVGDPIYMKMHFQRGQFNPDFMDMTIEEVCNLEHLKGSVANSLTVWLDKKFDNPDFFRKLKSFESTDATERRGDLYLLLLDYTRRQTLRIHSRKRFVIDKPLVDFLKEWGIQFRVETAG